MERSHSGKKCFTYRGTMNYGGFLIRNHANIKTKQKHGVEYLKGQNNNKISINLELCIL